MAFLYDQGMISQICFSTMFLGSAVARGFQMGRTKTMYEITHGLAPCFKSILNDAIGRSDVYTYLFDESLNEVTQSSEIGPSRETLEC